jgi:chromate transporter
MKVGLLSFGGPAGQIAVMHRILVEEKRWSESRFLHALLWIFLGAPYVEHLRGNVLLSAALSAITAAVVGVILNLAVWFALHVAFGHVEEWRGFGLRLLLPDLATANIASIAIALGAFFAMFTLKWSMIPTLGVAAALGVVYVLILRA